jgi:hypothetical protein
MLTEPQKNQICSIVGHGGTRQVAAEFVGCDLKAIMREAHENAAFRERLAQAESMCEITHLKNIRVAAEDPKQWRASAWLLERKFPDHYGKRKPRTITAEQAAELLGKLTLIVLDEVPDDAIRARIEARIQSLLNPKQVTLNLAAVTDERANQN